MFSISNRLRKLLQVNKCAHVQQVMFCRFDFIKKFREKFPTNGVRDYLEVKCDIFYKNIEAEICEILRIF